MSKLTDKEPILYGVWRPGKGFLAVRKEDGKEVPLATLHWFQAWVIARWLGHGARVTFVSQGLYNIQNVFREADDARAKKPKG
jgi:hypothetical protein